MSTLSSELAARPVSDYLYFYWEARKPWRFLYYCRRCIRNFDTSVRVPACPRCSGSSIVELPKSYKPRVRFGRGGATWIGDEKLDWKKMLLKTLALIRVHLRADCARLLLALRRLRIWIYYRMAPAEASSSLRRGILAERRISEFV